MNKLYRHFGMGILALVAGTATMGAAAPAPSIAVDEPHFNFGEQHNDQVIEHTFVVRNEGDASLEITNIRSSCGCTVGHVSSRSIPPGGTAEISGRFNLKGRQGTQRSVLTLETNDPNQPRTQLTIGGVAVMELQIRPNRVFFGQVYSGQESTRRIEITSLPDAPFEITKIETDSEHFSAEALDTEAATRFRVDVATRAPQAPGMIDGVVRIHTTHPKYPVLQVPVNAQVAGALTYAPSKISLLAGNETPVTRYVVVRAGSVQDFEITEITPPIDDIQVQVLNMPNQGYRIQLTNLRPSDALNGRALRIHTNVDGMSVIDIPFQIIEASN